MNSSGIYKIGSLLISLIIVGCGEQVRRSGWLIGKTDEEIIAEYGQPYKIYYAETAPENYYISGWSHPKERVEISNKLFIYNRGTVYTYFYFDKNNRVEGHFTGGS